MGEASLQDDNVCVVRFSPERNGLKPVCLADGWGTGERRKPGEHFRNLSISLETTKDHGLMMLPVTLPRHLMPNWSKDDWISFFNKEMSLFHSCVNECVVQCISLAIVANDERRRQILKEATQVVVDFRGDLPNAYLPMMLGGYKVGVYRNYHGWPIWMSIQPTYDLALKEATKLRAEANSDEAVVAAEALEASLKVLGRYGGHMVGLIVSDKQVAEIIPKLALLSCGIGIAIGTAIGWFLK